MADEQILDLGPEIATALFGQPNVENYSTSEKDKLTNIEAEADKTDAENVAAAGAVMKSAYDANTILAATADNTPVAVTVAENRLLGRKTGGNIDDLQKSEVLAIINCADGSTSNPGITSTVISNAVEGNPNVIAAALSGTTYSNEGATSRNFHTLPTAGVGTEFSFYVQDDAGMTISVGASGHFIRVLDQVSTVGGSIDCSQVGAFITLKRVSTTEWAAKEIVGTWAMSEYVPPPEVGNDIVPGMCALWDAKSYVSGQTVSNSIDTPADGAASTDYDVWFGVDGNVGTDEPTFSGNSFDIGSSNDFFKAKGSNPLTIANMHKTQSGTSWTYWIKVKTPELVATLDTLFSTAANTGDRGIKIRSGSDGALKLDHYDGTTLKTFAAAQKLIKNARYDLFVAYDYDTNQVKFSVGGSAWQTLTADLTDAITGSATYPFTLAADADNTSHMEQGAKIYGEGIIDHMLTDQELAEFIAWSEAYYSPEVIDLPDAPQRIIHMPGDTEAYFNVVVPSTGGASITSYAVQKKLLGADDSTYASTTHTSSGFDIECTGLTNDVDYTFRFAAITAGGQGDWSDEVDVTPKAAGTVPYDPQYYKITECVLTNGSRTKTTNVFAREIGQPAFNTYRSAFFGLVEGKFVFKVCNGGPTTSNGAKYARVELRHLTNIANGTPSEDTLKFSVPYIANGHKVITHQIHGFGDDDNPYFKVVYYGKDNGTGKVYVLYKLTPTSLDETPVDLLTDVVNGDIITLRAVFTGTGLSFYVNGSLTPINCPGLFQRTTEYYWKRGAYYQSLEDATTPYAVCEVHHHLQSGQYVP